MSLLKFFGGIFEPYHPAYPRTTMQLVDEWSLTETFQDDNQNEFTAKVDYVYEYFRDDKSITEIKVKIFGRPDFEKESTLRQMIIDRVDLEEDKRCQWGNTYWDIKYL